MRNIHGFVMIFLFVLLLSQQWLSERPQDEEEARGYTKWLDEAHRHIRS